jgi:hypothetical protein
VHAESIILSVPSADSMILSARAESIILSAGDVEQQSTKSCSGKCGYDCGGRGDTGSGNRFDIGSGNDGCSNDSNGYGNVVGDSSDSDSGDDDRTESIIFSERAVLRVSYSQRVALRVLYSQRRL